MIAWDTETFPIRHRAIAPKLVTLTRAWRDGPGGVVKTQLFGNGDADQLDAVEDTLKRENCLLNAAYDLNVVSVAKPSLIPLICSQLEEGMIHDVKVREKLLVLATGEGKGNLKFRYRGPVPTPAGFGMVQLSWRYLKKDRSEQKGAMPKLSGLDEDGEPEGDDDPRGDLWRYNYDSLDGWVGSEYPKEAAAYAEEDSHDTLVIYEKQEPLLYDAYRSAGLVLPASVEALHVAAAYYLYMASAHGVPIDLEAVERLKAHVDHLLSDDQLSVMIAAGILRASQPAQPYANLAKAHRPECKRKDPKNCPCPVKIQGPQPQSEDLKALHALIENVCKKHGKPVVRTPTGRVSASADVLEELKGLNPALDKRAFRQEWNGIRTREIPRMNANPVHPHYNELVSSGRVSCSASKLYPSGNITNVDPKARACYVCDPPDEVGPWVLGSCDYGAMELVTLAQQVYRMFGFSSLRNQINSGMDPHAYLGTQIAYATNTEFAGYCDQLSCTTKEERYREFMTFKLHKGTPERQFFDENRTFAKPTGLGYPGGLGPETFVAFAKGNYGITIDLETATRLREIWYETYPEMVDYFNAYKWNQKDHENSGVEQFVDGSEKFVQRYKYTSPLGMLRSGCKYTEGVNGMGLQTPGAELAKIGLIRVYRACFDPSVGSILYGNVRPLAFIHDEILFQVRYHNKRLATLCCEELARLMVDGGQVIVPDVTLKAVPCLMEPAWNKDAEPVYDADGCLVPWRPKKALFAA